MQASGANLDHPLPVENIEYGKALEYARHTRAALDSFRLLYDRQLDASKWLGAFSLGALLGLASTTNGPIAAISRPFYAVAMIALATSLLAALTFYARYLRVIVFLHAAETRLGELNVSVSRLEGRPPHSIADADLEWLKRATEAVGQLRWPRDAEQRADQRAWRICLAGFLVALGVIGGVQFGNFLFS